MSEDQHMDIENETQSHTTDHSHSHEPVTTDQQQQEGEKRFTIKKWTAVGFWSWDMEVEDCPICRNHLMEPCISCQQNSMTDAQVECPAAWGVCNHGFHLHCINQWLTTRNVCPLDNQVWKFKKYGK
ncbi:hypothetical protein ACO0RG_000349 [Hanseniaspora osmophila]|uniref:RING-box protein HRT1 n=1 Tax=Hanseniaspora osmophila TaxID=56408 RepID=A0A1E5R5B6_9ASCO|nr:RING-box protein HRT1 [Hanseniaspora osmophila]